MMCLQEHTKIQKNIFFVCFLVSLKQHKLAELIVKKTQKIKSQCEHKINTQHKNDVVTRNEPMYTK